MSAEIGIATIYLTNTYVMINLIQKVIRHQWENLHFLKSRISFYKYYIANEPNILNEILKFIDMTISSQNYLKFSFFPCG